MQKSQNILKIILAIIGATIALRLSSLGLYPLFDPTEGRYAEIGRKMLETGNFVTPFIEYNVPFWAKPPLSFWLTAISYKIFGVTAFAARLPSFCVMLLILWLVYKLSGDSEQKNGCTEYKDKRLLATLVLGSMGLFFYLAGGVMTDPALGLGVVLSLAAFWRSVVLQQHKKCGYLFFVGLAISMLAKGPIGVVLTGMPIFIWVVRYNKWRDMWQFLPWVWGTLLVLLLVLPWYIMAEIRTPGFLNYFIVGEHFQRFLDKGWKGDLYGSGRAHAVGTIWVFAFAAMLPWSLLLVVAIFVKNLRGSLKAENAAAKSWQLYVWLWALTPMFFFTMAKNILITYVVTAMPAVAIIIAPMLFNLMKSAFGRNVVLFCAVLVPLIFSVALAVVNFAPDEKWIKSEEQIIKAYQNADKGKNTPLFYLEKHAYSEDFYTHGKTTEIKTEEELLRHIDKEFFVVMPPYYYYKVLSQNLRNKLAIVAQKNNSIMLHNIP